MTEKIDDSILIAALVSSRTKEEAANVAGVNPQTIYRRLRIPEFKREYQFAQSQVLASTVKQMTDLGPKAVMKLEELLESDSERVQLQVVKLILQFGSVLRRDEEFEDRLQALEEEKQRRNLISVDSND